MMQEIAVRALDENERRRVGAMMLAAAQGAPASSSRDKRRNAGRRAPVRHRERGHALLSRLVPLLLEMPGRLNFKTAFCVAAAAWGAVLVIFLGYLEVLPW